MAKHSWFPLYWDDYLADTQELTAAQHGAYLLILIELYRAGGTLPYDEKMLQRITRLSPYQWKSFSQVFDKYFIKISKKFHHPRVTKQLARQGEIATQAVEKATKASSARWGGRTKSVHAPSMLYKSKANTTPSQDRNSLSDPVVTNWGDDPWADEA